MSPSELVGAVRTSFDDDRSKHIKEIADPANSIIASYDKQNEGQKLSGEMQSALVGTAAMEGVIGIGAILAASMADVTGNNLRC